MNNEKCENSKYTPEQEMSMVQSQFRAYGLDHGMTKDDMWEVFNAGAEIIFLTRTSSDHLVKKILTTPDWRQEFRVDVSQDTPVDSPPITTFSVFRQKNEGAPCSRLLTTMKSFRELSQREIDKISSRLAAAAKEAEGY